MMPARGVIAFALILCWFAVGCSQAPEDRLLRLSLQLDETEDFAGQESIRKKILEVATGDHEIEVTISAWQTIFAHDLYRGEREDFETALTEARAVVNERMASQPDNGDVRVFAGLVEARAIEGALMVLDQSGVREAIERLKSRDIMIAAVPQTILATNDRIKNGVAPGNVDHDELDLFTLFVLEETLQLNWVHPEPDSYYAAWCFCRKQRGEDACGEILVWLDEAMASTGRAYWKSDYMMDSWGMFSESEMTAMFGDEWKDFQEGLNDLSDSGNSEIFEDDPNPEMLMDMTLQPMIIEDNPSQ